MINTSDLPTLHSDDVLDSAVAILQELGQKALAIETKPGKANPELMTDGQARHRLAVPIFLRRRKDRPLAKTELMKLYNLCITSDDQTEHAVSLYTELTGEAAPHLKDVSGVRTPIRAMFVLLWIKGKVTLPHNFTIAGVWAKYPELKSESETFIYNVSQIKTSFLHRSSRAFQYRVNWHKPKDVDFTELWEAAPAVVDKQRAIRAANNGNKTNDFSYLAWIHCFAKLHPQIVSPEQARALEGYHAHLSMTAVEVSSEEHRKTYKKFVQYWGALSGKPSRSSILERNRIRYHTGIDGRKTEARKKIENKTRQAEANIREALDVLSPEEYAILPGRKRRSRDNFEWIDTYYTAKTNPHPDKKLSRWAKLCELHLAYIEEKLNIAARRQEVGYVHILMDYLGTYLPAWFSKNPDSPVEFPELIENFHRSIFWARTAKLTTFTNPADNSEVLLPLTLLQFYDLKRSQKTKSTFINVVWRFFEVGILHGAEIMPDGGVLIDSLYKNPVNPRLDYQGSGSAGKSDKIPLPIDSMLMVEAYMLALDAIGVELQNRCLSGMYSHDHITELRNGTWIDLERCGISYTIKLWNPSDTSESIEIPLKKIINIYSWRNDKYQSNSEYVCVPWLSQLRMLTVALFSGLRLQNCQWLDVRNFDKYYDSTLRGSIGSCILFVNTDKSGNSRPVTLPYKVMDVLIQERHFQTKKYRKKYNSVNYQNDPKNKSKYKAIHPLFRSPWNENGAPFSDTSYSVKWTLILRGFQEVYNSFAPAERRHEFVECDIKGEWSAVHTPHALRATWITHRRVYAFLDYAIIGIQVGHAQEYTTAHYVVPTSQETVALIDAANRNVSQHAFAALTNRTPSPSSQTSALVKGWGQNKEAVIRDQHLISVIPEIMDTDETGIDLIASTKEQRMKFMDCCICALDGDCPKKLMDFTRMPRTCGICPYAVFGVDHLPGLNAKVRDLANRAEQLKLKLQRTHKLHPESSEIGVIHEELSLCMLELAGYRQSIQILEKNWREEKFSNGYIARHRDLSTTVHYSVDMTDPKQRVISMLIDASQFPGFASEHYPLILDELTRNPEFMHVVNQPLEEREIYIGQILSIMGGTGISFEEISAYALSKPSALLLSHEGIRA
ncbi:MULTISPECIES: site-specific integrase [unclassified Pseudomonas]|uniref:site-specific integrase n=1 Tax=unclassified Pseudomonas TaxID=196821 RepID=UPI000CD01E15|nr:MULTISPECIES: site-specific integrase [unclassified Pseudomonas]POA28214.1 site-specific integrase [Pseudomonas sp. GW456-R21]POA62153.1 site-specific integrase [Pseudomonas sp. GW460-R15]